MNEKTKNRGAKKCAKSHVLCAESHSQHNGNVKKDLSGRVLRWKIFIKTVGGTCFVLNAS